MTMNEYVSSNLLSHPDRSLKDHLLNVAKNCKELLESKFLNFKNFIPKNILSNLSYLIGLCHDFGKATSYFQLYITEKDEKKRKQLKSKRVSNHGLLSALFCYYIIQKYISNLSESNDLIQYLPILGYFIVKRHHGNLKDASTEIYDLNDDVIKSTLLNQLNSIDINEISDFLNFNLKPLNLKVDLNKFKENFNELCDNSILKSEKSSIRKLKYKKEMKLYFLNHLLYSILLDSDKNDAIFKNPVTINRINIQGDLIDKYKQIKGYDHAKNEFDKLRNEIYEAVTSNLIEDRKILSLNAPTGSGKTLTAISFALKLRNNIKKHQGYLPRIIYCLPFLSIIDQNFEVLTNVFSKVTQSKQIHTSLLLKHHHLSDVFYQVEGNEFETHESEFLIEGWKSEIIVTTFIQLFHSIISNRNRAIRKFHNIVNSIILLDEVQSIPHKYWFFLKKIINFLSDVFNVRFIFMTATLPLIFNRENDEIFELLLNHETYFRSLNRINMNLFLDSDIHIEDFKDILKKKIIQHKNKDFLIVLNTISCCREIFNFLKSLSLENTHLYYLSTHVIPKERIKRIKQIKNDVQRKIIVSTQLIEAGVDIDVEITYRDFGPLDSINQVAGRCNRNNSNEDKGEVYVYILKDNKKEYFKYIYESFLIDKTKDVFRNRKILQESQFLTLNNEYFKKINESHSLDKSRELFTNLIKLEFKELSSKFKIIKEKIDKVDVFIEYDETASTIWQQFEDLERINDPFQRRNAFLKLKKEFYSYVISINKNLLHKLPTEREKFLRFSFNELETIYSPEIGFIPNKKSVIIF